MFLHLNGLKSLEIWNWLLNCMQMMSFYDNAVLQCHTTTGCQTFYQFIALTCISPTPNNEQSTSGASCIKISVDFILKVYVRTKARFWIRTKVFRFIKPYVRQNLRKNPFINPSQGKIVHTCISTLSPPWNNYIWSLQHLGLLCITSSAYHFRAYSHPCDTMFNTVKGTRR